MRNLLLGFLIATLLGGLVWLSNEAVQGARAYAYLNETVFKDATGRSYTREQVLDYLMMQAISARGQ